MPDLTLHLSPELDERLKRVADENAKAPDVLVEELLERYLEPSLEFIGAWKDSDIMPEDITRARTSGRTISLEP